MKRLLLVVGPPGHGKTTLANELAAEHSFYHLSVDEVYVDFVKHECQMLYFDALNLYIGPHYEHILADRKYSKAHLKRDFVAEWRCHLATRVQEAASLHDSVVAEGYLLGYCIADEEFQRQLSSAVEVSVIEVRNYQYWQNQRLSISQVAALGMDQTPTGSPEGGAE